MLLDGKEDFSHLPSNGYVKPGVGFTPSEGTFLIPTLEGDMQAVIADWIIRGVKGEFYPCKPDIFEQTYEPVLAPWNDRNVRWACEEHPSKDMEHRLFPCFWRRCDGAGMPAED
jgi:hypothetical protein